MEQQTKDNLGERMTEFGAPYDLKMKAKLLVMKAEKIHGHTVKVSGMNPFVEITDKQGKEVAAFYPCFDNIDEITL